MCDIHITHLTRIFLAALRRRNAKHFNKMQALGIPDRVENRPPLWGAMQVEIDSNGLWQPAAPDRETKMKDAIIIAAGRHDEWNTFYSSIDDLICFFRDDPSTWWLMNGSVRVLGDDAIFDSGFYQRPLRLLSTPLSWLQAGGDGAVIVDWRLNPMFELGEAPAITCDTAALRDRLLARRRECQSGQWPVTVQRNKQVAA